MTFKEKIVKLRKLKGLTQDEFASAVGVSRQAVYKWESGQSYPEVAKLLEIKLLFNISIDDLLDESYEVIVPEKKRKRLPKEKPAEVIPEVQEKEEEVVPVPTEVVAEEVKEEPALPEAEPVKEDVAEEKEEVKNEPEAQPKKKVGFFGRLFGRK